MGVNKVVFGEKVIMDTTEATVTPQTMVKGVKALGANGEMLTGTLNTSPLYNNLDQTNEGYALDARQGKVLNDKINEKLNKNYSSLTTLPSDLTTGDKLLINRLNNTYIINYEDLSSKIISEITPSQIGAVSTNDVINVLHGGTGATDAAGARANLGTPSTTGAGASGTWGINVSGSAGSASVAGTLITATRISSANTIYGDGRLRVYLSSESMTSGKPPIDGIILHGAWDWEAYNGQLCIGNNSSAYLYVRGCDGSTWGDWHKVFTDVEVIPVANGGTGATSATGARTNLDVYSKSEVNNAIQQSAAEVKIRTVSVPYTVIAGGNYNTNLKSIIDADLPAGHKCIGIGGFTTGNVYVVPITVRYVNYNYSFQVSNISQSDWSENATIDYMYTRI